MLKNTSTFKYLNIPSTVTDEELLDRIPKEYSKLIHPVEQLTESSQLLSSEIVTKKIKLTVVIPIAPPGSGKSFFGVIYLILFCFI